MWGTAPAVVGTDCWARTADPRNLPGRRKLKERIQLRHVLGVMTHRALFSRNRPQLQIFINMTASGAK